MTDATTHTKETPDPRALVGRLSPPLRATARAACLCALAASALAPTEVWADGGPGGPGGSGARQRAEAKAPIPATRHGVPGAEGASVVARDSVWRVESEGGALFAEHAGGEAFVVLAAAPKGSSPKDALAGARAVFAGMASGVTPVGEAREVERRGVRALVAEDVGVAKGAWARSVSTVLWPSRAGAKGAPVGPVVVAVAVANQKALSKPGGERLLEDIAHLVWSTAFAPPAKPMGERAASVAEMVVGKGWFVTPMHLDEEAGGLAKAHKNAAEWAVRLEPGGRATLRLRRTTCLACPTSYGSRAWVKIGGQSVSIATCEATWSPGPAGLIVRPEPSCAARRRQMERGGATKAVRVELRGGGPWAGEVGRGSAGAELNRSPAGRFPYE